MLDHLQVQRGCSKSQLLDLLRAPSETCLSIHSQSNPSLLQFHDVQWRRSCRWPSSTRCLVEMSNLASCPSKVQTQQSSHSLVLVLLGMLSVRVFRQAGRVALFFLLSSDAPLYPQNLVWLAPSPRLSRPHPCASCVSSRRCRLVPLLPARRRVLFGPFCSVQMLALLFWFVL